MLNKFNIINSLFATKRAVFVCIILASFSAELLAQPNQTLIAIGKTKISKSEFEWNYKKNNNNLYNPADKKTPEEYVQLFVDFKLKVIEAEHLKMDTSTAFIHELAQYRTNLAAPYLTDITITDQMVKDLYNRTTKEINASHLLLTVEPNESKEEVVQTFEKIVRIRNEILAGKDFSEAALEYSQDPSVKKNKGKLGYFTALQTVVQFENAAFSTPVGQVSEPVRTQYGWHLLKVHHIRNIKGMILVAHIMKTFPKNMTAETKAALKLQIDSIYAEVKNGADFAKLAREKSDDKQSAQQGGEIPSFSDGEMIAEFSAAAFALENNGDISQVVETPIGFHIIKKIDSPTLPSFEQMKNELEAHIKKEPLRRVSSNEVFVSKLKKEYNFTENQANVNYLMAKNIGDSTINTQGELFVLNGNDYKTEKYIAWLNTQGLSQGTFNQHYPLWVETEIVAYENSRLELKYPDFKYLLQEYHDGILLFNISEKKIWNHATQDSVGLEKFYQNAKKYNWKQRFKGAIVTCISDSVRREAEKYFDEGLSAQEVIDLINKNELLIQITDGAWEKGTNVIVDYFVWNCAEPEGFDKSRVFILGHKISPSPKLLHEARGLYISDYQNYIEDSWVKELRNRYKVVVNTKLLKTIAGA